MAPSTADESFGLATKYHQAGQLAEAERAYRKVLDNNPHHAGALHYLGVAALQQGRLTDAVKFIEQSLAQRNDAQAHYHLGLALAGLSRFAEAADHNHRAIALKPDFIDAHNNLGNVFKALGRLDEAAACYRHVIGIKPALASAHYNLGNIFLDQGENGAAISAFERALSADPSYLPAQIGHALALRQQGRFPEALAILCPALDRNSTTDTKSLFVECCRSLTHYSPISGLYKQLITALTEPWTRPRNLAGFADAVMRSEGPSAAVYNRATTVETYFQPTSAELEMLASDHLLRAVLENALVASTDLERILTGARRELLMMATRGDDEVSDTFLGFTCALARQCFISEYVFDLSDDEADKTVALRDCLAREQLSPFALAVAASYFPLHEMPRTDRLLTRSWPAAVEALLIQQVHEPALERKLRTAIPQLTAIDDPVSVKVQRQYEENPYPRWVKVSRIERTVPFGQYLRKLLPLASFELTPEKTSDILIAGCGTGQATLEMAFLIEGAKILAVDLSRSSLAHAQRKAHEASVDSVDFAQADILKLAALGRTFDFIEVGGVLHHMADPVTAWRDLAALLRPGGVMRLGLYSKTGTPQVLAARAYAAGQGIAPTPDSIRRTRQALRALPDGELAKAITSVPDFYSTSECRDLFFHVQEQRLTIPQIKEAVAQTRMRFLGFCVNPTIIGRYRARFPEDITQTNLDNWHKFESDNPDTFARMYVLVLQKAPNPLD